MHFQPPSIRGASKVAAAVNGKSGDETKRGSPPDQPFPAACVNSRLICVSPSLGLPAARGWLGEFFPRMGSLSGRIWEAHWRTLARYAQIWDHDSAGEGG